MEIRRATNQDMNGINDLLHQVLMVHHNGRPDLFKPHAKKYTDEELMEIIADDQKPIFVAVDEKENVLGYAFCLFQQYINNNILTDIKTLYIDDLCVDENYRGQHIGAALYHFVLDYAKANLCKECLTCAAFGYFCRGSKEKCESWEYDEHAFCRIDHVYE